MKKKPRWRKGISIFLVFALFLETFAIPVFAEENQAGSPEGKPLPSEAAMAESSPAMEEPGILGEMESLREETVKHFRLDDGTYLAVDYGMPVHCLDADGSWQDIDNTLQWEEGRYTSENGGMKKAFPSTLADGTLFEVSWQEHTVGMALAEEAPLDTEEVTFRAVEDTAPSGEAVSAGLVTNDGTEAAPGFPSVAPEGRVDGRTGLQVLPDPLETAADGTRFYRLADDSVLFQLSVGEYGGKDGNSPWQCTGFHQIREYVLGFFLQNDGKVR